MPLVDMPHGHLRGGQLAVPLRPTTPAGTQLEQAQQGHLPQSIGQTLAELLVPGFLEDVINPIVI